MIQHIDYTDFVTPQGTSHVFEVSIRHEDFEGFQWKFFPPEMSFSLSNSNWEGTEWLISSSLFVNPSASPEYCEEGITFEANSPEEALDQGILYINQFIELLFEQLSQAFSTLKDQFKSSQKNLDGGNNAK